ncbi:MAG: AraC family transcriptional regulator [Aeromicrobium erythreum]
MPLGELLDVDDGSAAERMLEPGQDDEALAGHLVDLLDAVGAERDETGPEVARLVAAIESDPTVVRVEQVAELAGLPLRTLQRRFSEYVGIGPRWVVRRFRLLDAAAVANRGGEVDWAALAADLGFSDQAHLVRSFTAVVGTPPARYTRGATP